MNNKDLESFLILRVKQLATGTLLATETIELVKQAIEYGKADFWYARVWSFRHKQYNLVIASEQDRYVLPKECVGVGGAREEDSTSGSDFTYKPKSEFNRLYPRLDSYTGGTPQIFTVYQDAKNFKRYIQFWPRPTITPIKLMLLLDTPADVVSIPDIARSALVACCFKYLYHPETQTGTLASTVAKMEIKELEIQDSPWSGDIWKFFDSTDEPVKVERSWI